MKFVCRALVPILLLSLPTSAFAAPIPDFSSIPDEALVPMACFAPGTDPALVDTLHKRFNGSRLRTSLDLGGGPRDFQFDDPDRWSVTATDGGGLGQGDPMTLTWSIVPDGTSIFGYNGEPTAPSNLRARLNQIYGSQAVWLPIFQGVFDRWSELNGVNYVYEPNDDGSAWTSTNIAAGQLGVRGDVRISGHFIDGNSNVLAYNFFPNFGDMVIDTGDNTYNNTSNNSLILRNILAHEHGHGLGLSHVCPVNQTKLMEPFLATAFDGPQFDDILATNRGYGDSFEHNDTPGTATNLGTIASGGSVNLDTRSIDDNSDPDLFRFTVGSNANASVTVTPNGSTYLSGPQNANGSCSPGTSFNALDNQNLVLEILGSNGSTVLASANSTGAGGAESLSNVALPGAGSYYVDVSGGSNEAQMYELSLSVGSTGGGGSLAAANVTTDDTIRTVNLSGFSTPRVVMGPPSFAGSQPTTVRVRNVTSSSFQHNLQEWDYLDGAHVDESMGYLALENGAQSLGSLDADAGTVNINHTWTTVNFNQSFSAAPVVVAQLASNNGGQAAATRIRNVTTSSFQVRLQEEEANDGTHAVERVDWVAVEVGTSTFSGNKVVAGRTGNSVTNAWATINFSSVGNPVFLAAMQTFDGSDPTALRQRNLSSTSVQVKCEEEQSGDTEVAHTTEVVGYIVVGDP
ncbi:MAG: H-type lectin domain-containing protein [Acidobacteriota bacterium]